MTDVEYLLRMLGLSAKYRGFKQLIYALELAVADEERLCAVTKEIYGVVALRYDCSWSAVERNIRTLIEHVWNQDTSHAKLIQLAKYDLTIQPTAAEFLDILSNYIRRKRTNASNSTNTHN